MAIGVSVILMRSFEVFHSYNNSYDAFLPGAMDWHRWALIGKYALKTLAEPMWGGIWCLVLFIFILLRRAYAKGETGFIVKFIFIYVILYCFIFVVSALGLQWLLSVAFDRMLYLLAPTAIFAMFYIVSPKDVH